MHFQIAPTSEYVASFGSVPSASSESSGQIKEKDKIVVKSKSADDYVTRPNNLLSCKTNKFNHICCTVQHVANCECV